MKIQFVYAGLTRMRAFVSRHIPCGASYRVLHIKNRLLRNNQLWKKLLLILFIPCLFFCNISWADTEPVPIFEIKETMIETKKTMKKEIIYFIKIYPDGKVHYHGNDNSFVLLGDKYAQLTKDQLNNLTTYFLSLPFEKSQAYQIKRGGDERFSGFINYKDNYINIEINDRFFADVLEVKLNKFINIRDWLCFAKSQKEYKYCLPENIEKELSNYQ